MSRGERETGSPALRGLSAGGVVTAIQFGPISLYRPLCSSLLVLVGMAALRRRVLCITHGFKYIPKRKLTNVFFLENNVEYVLALNTKRLQMEGLYIHWSDFIQHAIGFKGLQQT